MAELIRDEDEILSLVLANPEHPVAKRYLRDSQNALLETIALYLEKRDAIIFHFAQEQKIDERKKEQRELRAEHLIQRLALMAQNQQRLTLPQQQEYLVRTIKEIESKKTKLEQAIESANAKINDVDKKWKKRQEKFKEDLLDAVKDTPVVDADGKELSQDEFKEILDAVQNPSIKEKFAQPDLKKHVLELISSETELDKMKLPMAKKENVLNQLNVGFALCGGDYSSTKMLDVIKQNRMLGKAFKKASDEIIQDNANDIGTVLTEMKIINESKKELTAINPKLAEFQNKLDQVQKMPSSSSEAETPAKKS